MPVLESYLQTNRKAALLRPASSNYLQIYRLSLRRMIPTRPASPGPMHNYARLLLVGIACIFGSESLCILGPLRYEHWIHMICHAIFYSGVGMVCVSALLHWSGERRAE